MIRQMIPFDIPCVVALCMRMHSESETYRRMEFSAVRCEGIARLAISDGFAMVAMEGSEIIGFMCGCAVMPAFSKDLQACDHALYIVPEHRGSFAAVRLVSAYIQWAKERGCKLTTVGVTAGIDNGKAIEFYKHLGFRESGVQLVMEG